MRLTLLSLACIFTAYGQVSTGSIRGTVSDPSGAVVPDTVIVLTNIRTGVTQSVRTDGSGNYLIDFCAHRRVQDDCRDEGLQEIRT
jgi:hypothetical protein